MVDAGQALVEHLFREMQIDEEWAVRQERGFTWWAGGLAQRIWSEPPVDDFGMQLSRVHVQTDLLSGLSSTEQIDRLGEFTPFATMSCLVVHEGEVRLAASAYVHEETLELWEHLFTAAALLQVADAHATVDDIAEFTWSRPATSQHPIHGIRDVPHDALNVVRDVFVPPGTRPSMYVGSDFVVAQRTVGRIAGVHSTADKVGLTSEFPFGESTAFLWMRTDIQNPRLGNGLTIVLILPTRFPAGERGALALELNRRELAELTRAPLIGSWCPDPELDQMLRFVSFLPNSCALPGLASNFLLYWATRTKWAFEVLTVEEPLRKQPLRPAFLHSLLRRR